MKIGIYPGSFDPITKGHLDIIERASRVVDELVIGVLDNSEKSPMFTAEERVSLIKEAVSHLPNVKAESFHGLTVDFAKQNNARILVRGLRAVTDFEYELQIAQMNHKMNDSLDTIFFTTSVEYSYLSSSIVKEIAKYHGDISPFVPQNVVNAVYDKYNL
ncbi:MAG: pantetheine-phosphate adenylyltransferase [Lachnospiraceae bacterium]|nr:pantetheine-phosphate adenylyltransferase [Lachnospiraceae bacterium]